MKSTSEAMLTKIANCLIALLMVFAPFHALLTVWGASLVGHYGWLRAWNGLVLIVLTGVTALSLVHRRSTRRFLPSTRLVQLTLLFVVITVLYTLIPLFTRSVSPAASLLGLFQDVRFVVFMLLVCAVASQSPWLRAHWRQLVLGPALLVTAFAVLQLTVLPDDFLRHAGYSAATIEPYETINNDASYPRFASTLRGANPLGAYLVVVTGLLAAFYVRSRGKAYWEILVALTAGAMLASFSRSAWIGGVAAVGVVVLTRAVKPRHTRKLWLVSLGMIIITGVGFTTFRSNPHVQNALFHTSDSSKVAISSNDQRSTALASAAREVVTHPLGQGVGSAGPASVHNHRGDTKFAENYFLQIGQEMGWLGLGLFVAILVVLGRTLWQRRTDRLALACFASLVGLVVVNLLSHAWTDDTLAYVFWGLAGIAVAGRKTTRGE